MRVAITILSLALCSEVVRAYGDIMCTETGSLIDYIPLEFYVAAAGQSDGGLNLLDITALTQSSVTMKFNDNINPGFIQNAFAPFPSTEYIFQTKTGDISFDFVTAGVFGAVFSFIVNGNQTGSLAGNGTFTETTEAGSAVSINLSGPTGAILQISNFCAPPGPYTASAIQNYLDVLPFNLDPDFFMGIRDLLADFGLDFTP